jgi:hypothetical protein
MSQNNNKNHGLSIDFGDELSKNLTIHKNVKQEIIITTEDKLKLVLISTKEILTAQRDWWTPFGLLASFIATLCTANFKDTLGLTKEHWYAIFLILTIVSAGWLLKAFYKLYKNWGKDNLDNIIEKIKLKNTSTNIKETIIKETIIIEPKKILTDVPINNLWELNHWHSICASIVGSKMVFTGKTAPKGTDGSHIDLNNHLEIGKTYEVTCFVKSDINTNGMFKLWCHDKTGTKPAIIDESTLYKTPSTNGEIIKLNFKADHNRNIRIHLQYKPGQGRIEISDVKIYELKT